MIKLSVKHIFWLCIGLVLLVNVVILANVAINRSDVTAQVTLTERELDLPYRFGQNEENSGASFRFDFEVEHVIDGERVISSRSPRWLDKQKMLALGFAADEIVVKRYDDAIELEVFVALELNGVAYQDYVKRLELWLDSQQFTEIKLATAQLRVKRAKERESRLFVIDAAKDLSQLSQHYVNRDNVFFAKAIVRSIVGERYDDQHAQGVGYISKLVVEKVHCPQPFTELLRPHHNANVYDRGSLRYQVDIHIGKQFIPWVTDVRM